MALHQNEHIQWTIRLNFSSAVQENECGTISQDPNSDTMNMVQARKGSNPCESNSYGSASVA